MEGIQREATEGEKTAWKGTKKRQESKKGIQEEGGKEGRKEGRREGRKE